MDRQKLDRYREQAIEPGMEIVDPHHHLWSTASSAYGRYDLDDLQIDTSGGHHVVETVFIDCHSNYREDGPVPLRPVGETVFVAGRADESAAGPGARIAAIVSHADLTLGPAVTEALEAHVAAAGGRFRGIRHAGARVDDPSVPVFRAEPPAHLYRQADFQAGAKALAASGLSFEAWQYHPQIDDVVALAEAVPELSIVVNHLGGPLGVGRYAGRRDEVLADLRAGLAQLAGHDNVTLKVGGIGMPRFAALANADGSSVTSEALAAHWGDLLRFCIDTFGPDRAMFESNFPVDGETAGYGVLWNTFKKVSSGYTAGERALLFAGTARRVYRL